MALVTIHHWSDLAAGLRELRRVSRGPVVILTFDGDALDRYWIAADLRSGRWDARHGHLRSAQSFEGSLRLLVNTP